MDLYRSKNAIVRGLDPIVARLERLGVTPGRGHAGGDPGRCRRRRLLLALARRRRSLLLGVPVLAALRLILNLLDGALARRTGLMHPRGELYNELGDRLADIAFLAPVAFLPGADRTTVLLGVAGAIFASFAGIVAAGGRRRADLPRHPVEAGPDGPAVRASPSRRSSSGPRRGARSGRCCSSARS